MSMSFKEAASHAKQGRLFYRAFEKMEGVLQAAARAESALGEAEAKHQKLTEANEILGERVEALREEKDGMKADILQETREAVARANALWQQAEAKRSAVDESTEKALATATALADSAKAVLFADLEALGACRAEAEKELMRVQDAVSSLQQKVGGLG